MQKLTSADPETKSADIVADNIAQLRELFPEAMTEGKIDFDVLKQLLGGKLEERDEKYGLNWHGKRKARQLALTPSTGTLRPCPDESVDWDTTKNLMIEGDNLEVLKLLQKSYAGKVKLIYIDPPYNTGHDFVYPDDFRDSIRNYLELTKQVGGGGARLSSNTESSGRFHTDWLNMMYPRLKLARNLLREDGVIFVSIDDHEVHNLRGVMNEVFGEENFIACVIWQKVFAPKNSAKHFSEDHDYVLVYARDCNLWRPQMLARTEEMEARYTNQDNDSRGPWASDNLTARNYYGAGTYPVICPSGRRIEGPPSGRYWAVSKQKFDELNADARIWWGADGSNMPRLKRFQSEVQTGKVPQTLWFHEEVGNTQEAKKELIACVTFPDSDAVFETPKPTRLIRRMLYLATKSDEGAVILDFFGGSGSTLHAMFAQNAEDGGNRRCILVQLPEPVASNDGRSFSIVDFTKERLRRAGAKLRDENPLFPGDLGFRVFKLDSSNIRAWDPDHDDLEHSLQTSIDHLISGRSEQDVLFELLLKLGLDLTVPMEVKQLVGHTVHSIGAGALLVCLSTRIKRTEIEPLALGIVEWHRAQAPEGEVQVVFRDSSFEDDIAKTNLTAILQQHGLLNIRSL